MSVVIGTYNRIDFLPLTIETVRADLDGIAHEIVVVDGGSTDGTSSWLLDQRDIITIVQHNRGEWRGRPLDRRSWGYFMNLGFKVASGKYVCMLSDDCLVVPDAIKRGLELFEERLETAATAERGVGAVAFYWRNWPEEEEYRVGVTFGNRLFVNHGLYLRHALSDVGFVDEETYFFYQADSDLCLRMADAGYSCVESPGSFIEHHRHANVDVRSSNMVRRGADWAAYRERWERLGPAERKVTQRFDDPHRTADRYWKTRDA